MHRFFEHPKTRPCAACNLRCCGNKFANRIPRSHSRKGHTAQRMRRYVRHVERQRVQHEIDAQLIERWEDELDVLRNEIAEMLLLERIAQEREEWSAHRFPYDDDDLFANYGERL